VAGKVSIARTPPPGPFVTLSAAELPWASAKRSRMLASAVTLPARCARDGVSP
jgi:hypothetical protein